MLPIVRARSASLAARADMSFIIRSPLLDPKQRVLGYKLAWQPAGAGRAQAANVATLAAWVMPRSRDTAAAWLAGENQLFLQASPAGLRPDQLEGLVPMHTVLCLTPAELAKPETADRSWAIEEGDGMTGIIGLNDP